MNHSASPDSAPAVLPQGWISRHSEAFHHLPPPPLSLWLGQGPQNTGWTLHTHTPQHVEMETFDPRDPSHPASALLQLDDDPGDEAAPFLRAHQALCCRGLRVRVTAPHVAITLQHTAQAHTEAPLLLLEIAPGASCVLLETHLPPSFDSAATLVQNLHLQVRLEAGARLQHLRVVTPAAPQTLAHHQHTRIAAGARYAQGLIASASAYHLQRQRVQLQGPQAQAHHAHLLLNDGQRIDQQTYTRIDSANSASTVDTLSLAQGKALSVANAHTRIAPGCEAAKVRQRLAGVPLAGAPRLILRPHLEILHDNVQAAHGATWGALPQDALFYARQRGLDETAARALIIEGMAQALLQRCFTCFTSPLLDAAQGHSDAEQPDFSDPSDPSDLSDLSNLLNEWLGSDALHRTLAAQLPPQGGAL